MQFCQVMFLIVIEIAVQTLNNTCSGYGLEPSKSKH